MDNQAFKDLVQKQRRGRSTKEIARRAVEEEESRKQKKRRKRGGGGRTGGGYQSSSDEDDENDDQTKRKKAKVGGEQSSDPGNHPNDVGNDHKQQAEELALRYRDRAKERREGKDTQVVAHGDKKSDDANDDNNGGDDDPLEFLIVPHNKKGLDLSLVRKERQGLGGKVGSGTLTDTHSAIQSTSLRDAETLIVRELPDLVEAEHTLRDFVASHSPNHSTRNSSSQNRSMLEYMRGLLDWTIDWNDPPKLDAVTCGTAGTTLQHTNYSMAIDGHPSDMVRAWEVPRQGTRSRLSSSGTGNNTFVHPSPLLITWDLLSQVDHVFQARRRLLDAMKKSSMEGMRLKEPIIKKGNDRPRTNKRSSSPHQRKGKATDPRTPGVDGPNGNDDDDDDIFGGGIGEYVPQLAVPTIDKAQNHQPDEEQTSDQNDIFNIL
jgi:hypothetical protein